MHEGSYACFFKVIYKCYDKTFLKLCLCNILMTLLYKYNSADPYDMHEDSMHVFFKVIYKC